MRLGPLHVLAALVISIGANAALLMAFARKASREAPRAVREAPEVPFVSVPLPRERPPPRTPRPKKELQAELAPAAPARAELRAPAIPSAFVDPAVGPLDFALGAPASLASGEAEAEREGAVREAHEVQDPPRVRQRRLPRFPAAAEADGTEGYVVLRILIDRSGQVAAARVVSAEPPGVFEEAAMAAIRAWRFSPAKDGGRPVPVWARQTLRFELR